jgi:hypothetical protein
VENKRFIAIFICFIVLSFNSCNSTPKDAKAFVDNYDKNEDFIVAKKSNNIIISVKYLSSKYLACKEAIKYKQENNIKFIDSIAKANIHVKHFAIKLEGDTTCGDVMYKDIFSYPEYRKRVEELNFKIKEQILLSTGDKEYYPVLASMENTYSMTNYRIIHIVFSPLISKTELDGCNKYEIVFYDEILGTGITHFLFSKKTIESADKINN